MSNPPRDPDPRDSFDDDARVDALFADIVARWDRPPDEALPDPEPHPDDLRSDVRAHLRDVGGDVTGSRPAAHDDDIETQGESTDGTGDRVSDDVARREVAGDEARDVQHRDVQDRDVDEAGAPQGADPHDARGAGGGDADDGAGAHQDDRGEREEAAGAPEPSPDPALRPHPLRPFADLANVPWRVHVPPEEEERYRPPPPRPLPNPWVDWPFWLALVGIVGGPIWLVSLVLVDAGDRTLYWSAGALTLAGFVTLVLRLPRQRGNDDDDDGARV